MRMKMKMKMRMRTIINNNNNNKQSECISNPYNGTITNDQPSTIK